MGGVNHYVKNTMTHVPDGKCQQRESNPHSARRVVYSHLISPMTNVLAGGV